MTDGTTVRALRDYCRDIERTHAAGRATGHSYRPALRTLVEALAGGGARS